MEKKHFEDQLKAAEDQYEILNGHLKRSYDTKVSKDMQSIREEITNLKLRIDAITKNEEYRANNNDGDDDVFRVRHTRTRLR